MKNFILFASMCLCTQVIKAQTVWNTGSFTFARTAASQQDCIVPSTCLARQNTGVIYNAVNQTGGIQPCNFTPSNTEWAYGGIADWAILNYGPLYVVNGCNPPSMFNESLVLHLISENIYLEVTFTFWGIGNGGGGNFTYTRTTGVGPSVSNLTLQLMLQGFHQNINKMKPVLFNQGISVDTTITDSIVISLRNVNPPHAIVESQTALLYFDGSTAADFSAPPANYYITVNHRNSIETWSAAPVFLSSMTYYNFSSILSNAYGSNQILVAPNVWAFYSGDINQDNIIDNGDYTPWETDANNFASGYLSTDLNGNGSVGNEDYIFWETNSNNFVGVVKP